MAFVKTVLFRDVVSTVTELAGALCGVLDAGQRRQLVNELVPPAAAPAPSDPIALLPVAPALLRAALLREAEATPLDFAPEKALALSGRAAYEGEQHAGDVASVAFDELLDWGPVSAEQLVRGIADEAGALVPGAPGHATYDPALVQAIVAGLLRDNHLVLLGDGRVDLPPCTACQGDGTRSPVMDACGTCRGHGKVRAR